MSGRSDSSSSSDDEGSICEVDGEAVTVVVVAGEGVDIVGDGEVIGDVEGEDRWSVVSEICWGAGMVVGGGNESISFWVRFDVLLLLRWYVVCLVRPCS